MPSWVVERKEREPETGLPVRTVFAPPREQVRRVQVKARETSQVRFTWGEE